MIADIVVAAVLLISAVIALFRGFVRETLTIVGWIGAIFITLYGYEPVAAVLGDVINESWIALLIAASTLFLVSLVILTILSHMLASRVQGSMLSHLDRALGFVFGLVRGIALVSVVYLLGTLVWDEDNLPDQIDEARSLPLVRAGADFLASLAPENIFPGRDDVDGEIDDAVDDIREGVRDAIGGAVRKKTDEIGDTIKNMEIEERLQRLNQPEPETTPPAAGTDPDTGETPPPGAAPAETLPAPPGYEEVERSDMQRLIESNQ